MRFCDLSGLFFLNVFASIQILPLRVPLWSLEIFAYDFVQAVQLAL